MRLIKAVVSFEQPMLAAGMPNARDCPTRSEHAPCERKFLSSVSEAISDLNWNRTLEIAAAEKAPPRNDVDVVAEQTCYAL
jgi:hypothetical protein